MSEHNKEDVFLNAVREQLHNTTGQMDEVTRTQLRTARQRALNSPRTNWLGQHPALGFAVAAGLAAVLVIPLVMNKSLDVISDEMLVTDIELISQLEDFEHDVEFYEWLEDELDAG